MNKKRWLAILLLNASGIGLFCSWFFPADHGLWQPLDSHIFYLFNNALAQYSGFAWLVALTNNRAFDAISLLSMAAVMLHYWLPASPLRRRHIFMVGISMLFGAVLINQLGKGIPVVRPSPTLTFEHIHRLSQLVNIPTKDASADSFPGDHGMMLLIFCGYMLRYFGCRAFAWGLAILVVFILPRIMSGAHWFSDIAVGSLSMVSIALPWLLITPLNDRIIGWLTRYLPGNKSVN